MIQQNGATRKAPEEQPANQNIFGSIPACCRQPALTPCPSYRPRVDVRLDYENLHISLKELGWQPNAKKFIKVVQKTFKDLGVITRLVAYADWDMLSLNDRDVYKKWGKRAWQRDLAASGVETRYLVNGNRKNAVDMRLANDLRNLIEKDVWAPDAAEIIVLGTNDGDFRPVLETARQRRRRIILLAVKGGVSRQLCDVMDTDDIHYIDQNLELHSSAAKPFTPVSAAGIQRCCVLAGM